MNQFMDQVMSRTHEFHNREVESDSAIVQNALSARQVRLAIGRLQGRGALLPLSTWKRWRMQLKLTGRREYSREDVRLIVDFNRWLSEGGTVDGFLANHNITEDDPDGEQRVYTEPSQRQASAPTTIRITV